MRIVFRPLPAATIELPVDLGFAIPAVYDYGEQQQLTYTKGLNIRFVVTSLHLPRGDHPNTG